MGRTGGAGDPTTCTSRSAAARLGAAPLAAKGAAGPEGDLGHTQVRASRWGGLGGQPRGTAVLAKSGDAGRHGNRGPVPVGKSVVSEGLPPEGDRPHLRAAGQSHSRRFRRETPPRGGGFPDGAGPE